MGLSHHIMNLFCLTCLQVLEVSKYLNFLRLCIIVSSILLFTDDSSDAMQQPQTVNTWRLPPSVAIPAIPALTTERDQAASAMATEQYVQTKLGKL